MTALLSSRLPSARVSVQAAGPRALAGSGDGPSAAASGFDAVIVGYAASSKPPAKGERVPADRKPGDETGVATQSADERAKAALVLKRTRDDALRRHSTLPKSTEETPPAAAVNPAATSAAEVESSSSTGSPVVSVVVPVLAGSVAPDTASAGIAAPVPASNLPGVAAVPASNLPSAASEFAVSTSEAATMTGDTVPEATKVDPLAPGQPAVVASTSAQPQEDSTVGGAAGAPNDNDPQITTGDSSADLGVLPAPVTAPGSKTPATVSGSATVSPARDAASTKDAGTPGDGDATPGQAGREANKVGSVSLGQPVVVALAGPTLQGPADVTAVVPGTPAAPVLGVVPAISSPVPPPIPWTASASPVAGQAAPFALPAAAQEQVFAAVSPLLGGADGSYGIHLQLHPRDLGAVQVTVHIHHGEISIQMNAPDAAARDVLRGALSDLRQQLESQGLRPGSMEVGSGGAKGRQPETSWPRTEGSNVPKHGLGPADLSVASAVPASTTSLDLRM